MSGTKLNKTKILMILSALQANNMNFLETETQTGVPRQTIKRWHQKYGNEVNLTNYHIAIPKDEPQSEETVDELKERFNKAVFIVRMKMLCQMDRAVKSCYSVKYLADAMKIVHEISERPIKPPNDEKGIDVFQNILNQVNNFEFKPKQIKDHEPTED